MFSVGCLSHFHKVAFAAACCEKLIPNYNAFCRIENWGNPIVPRKALDEVWQILHGKPVNQIKIARLKADCGSEDVCPDLDKNYDFYYCWEAQEALMALDNTLQACIEPSASLVSYVAKNARDTVEIWITGKDESVKIIWQGDDEEKLKEAISNHSLAVREIAKQEEDLQRLQEIKILEPDFLKWLKNSFENYGRSNINLK